jgi:hypothetical protein
VLDFPDFAETSFADYVFVLEGFFGGFLGGFFVDGVIVEVEDVFYAGFLFEDGDEWLVFLL